jgi:hypothetical protein
MERSCDGGGAEGQFGDGAANLEEAQTATHRVESFKFSSDPQFARKVRDIVGLIGIRLTKRSC